MQTIFISGGSSGLGLALCRAFLESGNRVLTVSRKSNQCMEALSSQFQDSFRHHSVDLSQSGFLSSLPELSEVDGFISNAGIGMDGLLTLTSEEAVRVCLEVNLTAPILLAREVLKGMLLKGGGCMVFISSVAARTGLKGLTVYSATKGGLVAFSRSLAREYGSRGIRSNCVLPGFLETEMTSAMSHLQKERIARRTALGRLGVPEDVIGCVRFLMSEESRYVTGQEFVVDGGFTV